MRRSSAALSSLAAVLTLSLGVGTAAAEAKPTVGLRYPTMSPDGQWVAFDYRGDIWRAPIDGKGHADRLTIHDAQDTLPRISPDGKSIAFTSKRNGGMDLFVMPAQGGLPRQVTFHSAMELLCDWSPDGKRLLFLSNREPSLWHMDVYEIPVEGGTARRLTRDGGREATYSADGKQVVYARGFNTIYQDNYTGSGNYDVYLVDVADGKTRRLTDTPGNERWPALSKDGATVWFTAEDKGVANLYSMPAAGGARTQVTRYEGLDIHRPCLAADRRRVVFERGGKLAWADLTEAGAPQKDIPLAIQSDVRNSGLESRTVTAGGEHVHLSADGSLVAFALRGDLWTMPSGGGNGTRLATTPVQEEWPRFSPDGKRIAFAAEKGGNSDLYVMDLQSKKVTQVTKSPSSDFFHAWSPDGTRLVFSSERTGNRDIWSIELATGKEMQLTEHPSADDDPCYSPDGRWIAFDSGRDGAQAIYVMPAEGGAARRVTQGAGFCQVPTWSPDGSMIAYETFEPDSGRSGGLFAVAAAGGPSMQISRDGQGACWSRRGDWIYFTAERGGEQGVWRMPAPTAVQSGERVPFLGRIEVDRRRELADLFDEAWTKLKDGFYDARMHAVDWNAMRTKYREMAVDAENKDTFYNVVNQMLAELDASHLGIFRGGEDDDGGVPERTAPTGALGLDLDPVAEDSGARKIVAVMPGGPADKAGLRVGDILMAVNGQDLTKATDLDRVLAGTAGREIKVKFRPLSAQGVGEPREEAVTPLGPAALSDAVFEQWTKRSERRVAEATQNKVGYVHLDGMDPENLARFQQAVGRWNNDKGNQGMILDVRENGGGNIHVQLMQILQARPFVRLEPRGGSKLTQPQLYWDKPVVVLVNERSFSDAEVFPWSFKAAGLGKTVGMPTPGGVIGTTDITLSDGSRFRIPRVGWYSLTGTNLEGNGFVPDVLVPETTEDRVAGRDPQLAKAIELVLADIAARQKPTGVQPAPPAGTAPSPSPMPAPPPAPTPTPEPEPTPRPTTPTSSAGVGTADDPLGDVKPGEWVRYRVTMGGEPTVLRLSVHDVTEGKVVFRKDVESGGGFLPPLPDELARGPILTALPQWGGVKDSGHAQAKVGDEDADTLLVTLDMGGMAAQLVFTNAVPALGLLRVEVNKQVVLEALTWGVETPAAAPTSSNPPLPSPAAPAPSSPAPSPPAPSPQVPEAPAPSVPPDASAPAPGTPAAETPAAAGEGAEESAAEIANPLADAKVGEWMRFRQLVQGQETTVMLEVIEVTADEIVLKSTTQQGETKVEGEPLRRKRTATLALGRGRGQLLRKATETLTVAGQELECDVVTLKGRRGPEVSMWYSDAVPVTGLVKRTRGTEVVQELLEWGTR
jgi:tricorn protease